MEVDEQSGFLEISLKEGNYTQYPAPGYRVAEIRVKDNDLKPEFSRVRNQHSFYEIKAKDLCMGLILFSSNSALFTW